MANKKSSAVKREARKTRPTEKIEARKTERKRVPLTSAGSELEVPYQVKEQYPADNHFRWVNDEKGRIQRFEAAGWEKCNYDSKPVGMGHTTYTLDMYLMTCLHEFFKEDFDAQQAINGRFEESLRGGANQTDDNVGQKTYAPTLSDGSKGFSKSKTAQMVE